MRGSQQCHGRRIFNPPVYPGNSRQSHCRRSARRPDDPRTVSRPRTLYVPGRRDLHLYGCHDSGPVFDVCHWYHDHKLYGPHIKSAEIFPWTGNPVPLHYRHLRHQEQHGGCLYHGVSGGVDVYGRKIGIFSSRNCSRTDTWRHCGEWFAAGCAPRQCRRINPFLFSDPADLHHCHFSGVSVRRVCILP